jgi:hypothetical protein
LAESRVYSLGLGYEVVENESDLVHDCCCSSKGERSQFPISEKNIRQIHKFKFIIFFLLFKPNLEVDHRGDYSGYCVAAVVVAAVVVAAVVVAAVAVVIDGGGIAVQLLVVKDDYSEI